MIYGWRGPSDTKVQMQYGQKSMARAAEKSLTDSERYKDLRNGYTGRRGWG
jgi:hypothetical protein